VSARGRKRDELRELTPQQARRRSEPGAPLVCAITGASGAPYAVRLVEQLAQSAGPVSLIVSAHGWRLLAEECDIGNAEILRQRVGAKAWDTAVTLVDDNDRGAAPASGSALSRGMVVCPCSMGTLSAIAGGTSRSLIERAADVALKEKRPLVLVPREMPLSAVHLRNMLRLTLAGAVIIPASPAFYGRPKSIDDLVDFVVARILDHLGVAHEIGQRWDGERAR
jgi:4-hydroxy-3-polyprenylbenzoate decarboxylase